jgi:hypothetical protein
MNAEDLTYPEYKESILSKSTQEFVEGLKVGDRFYYFRMRDMDVDNILDCEVVGVDSKITYTSGVSDETFSTARKNIDTSFVTINGKEQERVRFLVPYVDEVLELARIIFCRNKILSMFPVFGKIPGAKPVKDYQRAALAVMLLEEWFK